MRAVLFPALILAATGCVAAAQAMRAETYTQTVPFAVQTQTLTVGGITGTGWHSSLPMVLPPDPRCPVRGNPYPPPTIPCTTLIVETVRQRVIDAYLAGTIKPGPTLLMSREAVLAWLRQPIEVRYRDGYNWCENCRAGNDPHTGCAYGVSDDYYTAHVSLMDAQRRYSVTAWEVGNILIYYRLARYDQADGPLVAEAASMQGLSCE